MLACIVQVHQAMLKAEYLWLQGAPEPFPNHTPMPNRSTPTVSFEDAGHDH
jgi:hypothetical protein